MLKASQSTSIHISLPALAPGQCENLKSVTSEGQIQESVLKACLLYTSDAADD